MIELEKIIYIHNNERDIEIPSLINSVKEKELEINSLLDIGAHLSWSYYAPQLRNILKNKLYDGIDIIYDQKTALILNNYYTKNVKKFISQKYDYICCISTLEHCGISSYKEKNYKKEQEEIFIKNIDLSNKYCFFSFPFGSDELYENEYANITEKQLKKFEKIAKSKNFKIFNLNFYFNEFPQGKLLWEEIPRENAKNKPMVKERGVQCVCLVEFKKEI